VLASSAPSADVDELLAAARDLAFPVFVKNSFQNDGRWR
jgi:pyruvate carboxylase